MDMLIGLLCVTSVGGFGVGLIRFIIKKLSKGDTKSPKMLLLLSAVVFVATMVLGVATSDTQAPPRLEEPVVDAPVLEPEWWEGVVSAEVAGDITAAFKEIGEDPEQIESIEYDRTRETALFDRRDYKVTFRMDSLNDKGWVHSRFYRITTEEWHEGEPEREQYPREYLVTIKFWTDDNTTNVLQWSNTGYGELQ